MITSEPKTETCAGALNGWLQRLRGSGDPKPGTVAAELRWACLMPVGWLSDDPANSFSFGSSSNAHAPIARPCLPSIRPCIRPSSILRATSRRIRAASSWVTPAVSMRTFNCGVILRTPSRSAKAITPPVRRPRRWALAVLSCEAPDRIRGDVTSPDVRTRDANTGSALSTIASDAVRLMRNQSGAAIRLPGMTNTSWSASRFQCTSGSPGGHRPQR